MFHSVSLPYKATYHNQFLGSHSAEVPEGKLTVEARSVERQQQRTVNPSVHVDAPSAVDALVAVDAPPVARLREGEVLVVEHIVRRHYVTCQNAVVTLRALHDGVAKQTSLEIHAQVRVSIENLSHRVEFDLRERHEGMLRALPRKILPVVSTLINKKKHSQPNVLPSDYECKDMPCNLDCPCVYSCSEEPTTKNN